MTEEEFVGLVGATLHHVTLTANLPGIMKHGLLPTAELCEANGIDPDTAILRSEAILLPDGSRINHQRPLLAGRLHDFIEDMSLAEWAIQLDQRVFFWPASARRSFQDSLHDRGSTTILTLDSAEMHHLFRDRLFLAPINSGAAVRRPSVRGRWLYVPASAPPDAFRENRRGRGLVSTRDRVAEVSLLGGLDPGDLLRVRR